MELKVAIIGAGNMGGAVARALVQSSTVGARNLVVSNPTVGKLKVLEECFPDISVTQNNCEAVRDADVVILAVKPWKLAQVINEIKNDLNYEKQVVASMAGGIGTTEICQMLQREDGKRPPVYYLIPNTAVAVCAGMTFMTSVGSTPEWDERMLMLFRETGEVLMVEEHQMNAGMALASCGIAYAMRYVRAAMEGGIELGLPTPMALQTVMQTMKGAAELLAVGGLHPEQEIDRVATPGGLTIRGLNAMEEAGFSAAVVKGLRASVKKN